jgi:alkylation response protein AidB-like acyl-CoA dehydrogenase
MTEILGGSDVRASTQTTAVHIEGNKYALYGLKWFTSAIDANVTFTLAKIKQSNGELDDTPTLFFLKFRDSNGKLNNINPIRLKDKLGTRQVSIINPAPNSRISPRRYNS